MTVKYELTLPKIHKQIFKNVFSGQLSLHIFSFSSSRQKIQLIMTSNVVSITSINCTKAVTQKQ